MRTYAVDTQTSENAPSSQLPLQRRHGPGPLQFANNRADAIVQRRFQAMANRSPRVNPVAANPVRDVGDGRMESGVVQRAPVVQLARRTSSPVNFAGGSHALRNLIYQWNHLPGIQVVVTATDYVGGSYKVTFSRDAGAISKQQADAWVQNALRHASSDSDSDGSDSDGSE